MISSEAAVQSSPLTLRLASGSPSPSANGEGRVANLRAPRESLGRAEAGVRAEREAETGKRPGGRSARVRRDVISAVIARLGEGGVAGLTVEAIAARAGVNKTTIYRRWPTLEGLVSDALLDRASAAVPIPDTGSFRGDLRQLADEVAGTITSPVGRALVNAVWVATALPGQADAPLGTLRREFWAARFSRAGVIVERAIARGEVGAQMDADAVLETLIAPLYFRVFISGGEIDASLLERVAELASRG